MLPASRKSVRSTQRLQLTDIAIPTFGYKNHVSIDRRHGIMIRAADPGGVSGGAQLIILANTLIKADRKWAPRLA